jgi:hypothetical protein
MQNSVDTSGFLSGFVPPAPLPGQEVLMTIKKVDDLKVWQKAVDLTVEAY